MKYLFILIFIIVSIFTFYITSVANKKVIKENSPKILKVKKAPKKRFISPKKKRFFSLVVPAIEHVHKKQEEQFKKIQKDIIKHQNSVEVTRLKSLYRVTDDHDLLLALKPHPQSIVIAQAAIESAWGTSRFFREANNIFGMWSKDPNEPRIAAGVKRNGTYTVWLRKFATLDESIKKYYITIGRVKDYKEFRALRYTTQDTTKLVKKLDKYSELGDKYTKMISSVIKHNNLTQYDK
ncbi:MAG: glucosaminidase domain-containing protein [Sulfurimonas sp.]